MQRKKPDCLGGQLTNGLTRSVWAGCGGDWVGRLKLAAEDVALSLFKKRDREFKGFRLTTTDSSDYI